LVGHVALMRQRRVVYRVLVEKREVKIPLGKHRFKWKDNTKTDLQDVRYGIMENCHVFAPSVWLFHFSFSNL
jgi:hypothetical protein